MNVVRLYDAIASAKTRGVKFGINGIRLAAANRREAVAIANTNRPRRPVVPAGDPFEVPIAISRT